ncbi:MAG: alanine/glycine:cation symporter family protein [Pirellulaceae bacterium]
MPRSTFDGRIPGKWFFLLATLLAALSWSPVAGQETDPASSDTGAQSTTTEDAASGEDAAASDPQDAKHSATEGDSKATAGPPPWMQGVDKVFGDYLVTPLETVLFFDFWTGQWLGTKIPFVVVWLFAGAAFFTIRMGFINVRAFWHAVRLTKGDYDDANEKGEVSHFQALASALSATVGLGNIAGVAIAVGTGGPGATFWIMVVGLLGMSSKFAECTLGQMYRRVEPDGTVSGGAMHYLREGLTDLGLRPLGVVLSVLFALLCIGASFGGGCAFQVGQSLTAIREEIPILDQYPWIYGLVMAVLTGAVIIGGIRSIGAVAGRIVPFMCGAYVLTALFIIFANITKVGPAFALIFSEAFKLESVYGGFLGVLVIGITRAVFSNEAGVGSAAIAHSAAKTNEPVSEGIVALLEPFIDTVVVCTMTSLVIVITGVYADPAHAALVEGKQGAALTAAAFSEGGYDWFRYILYMAVVLFAYSTLISWSYYGERSWCALFGVRFSLAYKILFLVFVVLGSIVTAGKVLDFSDLLILGMSFPNILGVVLLSGKVKRALDEYWAKYKSGKLKLKSG